jgi:hypothetical protein
LQWNLSGKIPEKIFSFFSCHKSLGGFYYSGMNIPKENNTPKLAYEPDGKTGPLNIPVFFRKLPLSKDSVPNALLLREVGQLGSDVIVEIEHQGQKWLVKKGEALPGPLAIQHAARKWLEQIEAVKKEKPNAKSTLTLAAALAVSPPTLRKRLKIIQEHLPKDGEEVCA